MDLKEEDMNVWTGFRWLRIVCFFSCGHDNLELHKFVKYLFS